MSGPAALGAPHLLSRLQFCSKRCERGRPELGQSRQRKNRKIDHLDPSAVSWSLPSLQRPAKRPCDTLAGQNESTSPLHPGLGIRYTQGSDFVKRSLPAVLSFCLFDCLPLHVGWLIWTAAL